MSVVEAFTAVAEAAGHCPVCGAAGTTCASGVHLVAPPVDLVPALAPAGPLRRYPVVLNGVATVVKLTEGEYEAALAAEATLALATAAGTLAAAAAAARATAAVGPVVVEVAPVVS